MLFRAVLPPSSDSNFFFFSRNNLSSEEFQDKVQLYEGLRSLWLSSTFPQRALSRSSFASHCPLTSPSSSRFTIKPFFSRIFFFIFDFIFVDLKVTILCALRFSFFLYSFRTWLYCPTIRSIYSFEDKVKHIKISLKHWYMPYIHMSR